MDELGRLAASLTTDAAAAYAVRVEIDELGLPGQLAVGEPVDVALESAYLDCMRAGRRRTLTWPSSVPRRSRADHLRVAAWAALLLAALTDGSALAGSWRARAASAFEQSWFAEHPAWMLAITAMAGVAIPENMIMPDPADVLYRMLPAPRPRGRTGGYPVSGARLVEPQ
ncbi:hypothetical protein [Micromonospora craniellae]|uniref:Uncharacterized protein n=1 Tax=Micromonospora craniellae TaxID=2294034 RepID=A0A372FXT3_9ACTN|nr:hypothetical protein [Micromonospora craniellae]RFS45617.1 hypothetical protein D0Q02_16115 [Micromonospora craniellae]